MKDILFARSAEWKLVYKYAWQESNIRLWYVGRCGVGYGKTKKEVAFCQNYIAPVIEAEDTAFLALTDNEREMFDFLVNKHYTLLKETMNKLL